VYSAERQIGKNFRNRVTQDTEILSIDERMISIASRKTLEKIGLLVPAEHLHLVLRESNHKETLR
jgi:hypothetical protein